MIQAANEHSSSIQATAKSVHAQTVRVVDEQTLDLGAQMRALDDFVSRARSENAQHHDAQVAAIQGVPATVEGSYEDIGAHVRSTSDRMRSRGSEVDSEAKEARTALEGVEEEVCGPLAGLRGEVAGRKLGEYVPTGSTPEKVAYRYPRELPRTESHEALLRGLNSEPLPSKSPAAAPVVFEDETRGLSISPRRDPPAEDSEHGDGGDGSSRGSGVRHRLPSVESRGSEEPNPLSMSLREINPNLTASFAFDPAASTASHLENVSLPLLKGSRRQGRKWPGRDGVGRENLILEAPRRKSPRLN